MVRRKFIREQAHALLKDTEVSAPPVPVERIAASLGAEIQRKPAEDKLSGFLVRAKSGEHAVIGVNARHHRHRRRFSVAHEIAHLLLHQEGEQVHVDRVESIFRIHLRNEKSAEGTDAEEKEANLFAAELLMPKPFVDSDMKAIKVLDEDSLQILSRRYDVSVQAMTFRLAYLGYFPLTPDDTAQ